MGDALRIAEVRCGVMVEMERMAVARQVREGVNHPAGHLDGPGLDAVSGAKRRCRMKARRKKTGFHGMNFARQTFGGKGFSGSEGFSRPD